MDFARSLTLFLFFFSVHFFCGFARSLSLFSLSHAQSRALGVVGACFRGADVWASIIVDGLHSDFESVKLAKQIKGDKLFLITDAVTGDQVRYARGVSDERRAQY